MTGVHTSAQQGFSTQAVTYAQGRPDYPRQLTGWLTDALQINSHSTVIDLGAGTGKFTGRAGHGRSGVGLVVDRST